MQMLLIVILSMQLSAEKIRRAFIT